MSDILHRSDREDAKAGRASAWDDLAGGSLKWPEEDGVITVNPDEESLRERQRRLDLQAHTANNRLTWTEEPEGQPLSELASALEMMRAIIANNRDLKIASQDLPDGHKKALARKYADREAATKNRPRGQS